MTYRRIAQLRTPAAFRAYLDSLGIDLPFDKHLQSGPEAPLARPYTLHDGFTIGNRFCTQPMEGWDGTLDGRPSDLTFRRWRNFGKSGAKLVWGGEAVAVSHAGRANPNQLWINETNLPSLAQLRQVLVEAHERLHGRSDDLLIGLQLTHSGRFARPDAGEPMRPVIAYHHPYLDEKFAIPADHPLISDGEIEALVDRFVNAAQMAAAAGFAFVDIKHCHGYLSHELLSAYTRPGPYGGSFANRTRFLRQVVRGVRKTVPDMRIGVRLSAFDLIPFAPDPASGKGTPVPRRDDCSYWFGADNEEPSKVNLTETIHFLNLLTELDIELVNLTAGSPYYNPHIQRPALFPPSDGYLPPEDPLVGVARQIAVTSELKQQFPNLLIVGTAYSYLQEWLAPVAQYHVRTGQVDFVGLGRLILSYPEYPADILGGRPLDRKRLCRTFSDCTTAPRNHLVSGCYPLDDFYKQRPEAQVLAKAKKEQGREPNELTD